LRELSLHIMDIIENGIGAGADLIRLSIEEDHKKNMLRVIITDNGQGIPEALLEKVTDPFYTTRTTRRVGLGLSLFREASRRCEGDFKIESRENEGTRVEATFRMDHIDLAPMGDIEGAMTGLMMGSPEVDFVYSHHVEGQLFHLDTRTIKRELEGVPINHPKVLQYISETIREGLVGIRRKRDE